MDCGTLAQTITEAQKATTGGIRLVQCQSCQLLFNRSYRPELIRYGESYNASLTCSEAFNRFQEQLAARLARTYKLTDRTILEIGCGKGSFLRLLCETAGANGIGIDPSIDSPPKSEPGLGRIQLKPVPFDTNYTGPMGDFVCCLSVFENIADIKGFLGYLRHRLLGTSTAVYLEVFNAMRSIADGEVWSIFYEQCNYFSLESLRNTVARNGFRIIDSCTCFENDQYLFVEMCVGENDSETEAFPVDRSAGRNERDAATRFANEFSRRRKHWENRLELLAKNSHSGEIVFWGAGGKAISFLNLVRNSRLIRCVVDNNIARHHRFIPGTGHPVLPPDELTSIRPSTIILSNPIYRDEIQAQTRKLGIDAQIEIA